MNKAGSSYIKTVNIAKGIGIILVVIGHYQPAGAPLYFTTFIKAVYKFHMPLFFMLSGYLFAGVGFQSYSHLIKKKIKRLLYPFIFVAILFVIIKYVSGMFFTLHHPLTLNEIKEFFICPINSFAPMLWFVQVLIIIFVIFPLIENLLNNKLLIFFFSVILYSVSVPRFFCLTLVFQSLPYFTIGTLLSTINFDYRWKKIHIISGAVFGLLLYTAIFYNLGFISYKTHKYIAAYRDLSLGMNGILICILLSVFLYQYAGSTVTKYIEIIGYYSMSIYLFHTIFMNVPLIFLFQVLNIDNMPFEAQASIAISSGVICPLLLEKYVLRKNYFTRHYLLGISK